MSSIKKILSILTIAFFVFSCTNQSGTNDTSTQNKFTGAQGEVKLMTLDPGHFHAALVQKNMYEQVDPTVYVYAPEGVDIQMHLDRIDAYNTRTETPTSWVEKVYTGPDYLEKMLSEKPGNVMITAGNNSKKTDYILKSVEAGINVLADKPMVIAPEEFPKLEKAFQAAAENGVLLYDIMTERYEITTTLQRELSKLPEVFGKLQQGTAENPAITKESVHHFFKYVSGNPLTRPAWYFDTKQQGEGIVDVTTHLVDLIQWEAFPEVVLQKEDVNLLSARHWTTEITPEMFQKVTGLDSYPDFLQKDVDNDVLKVFCNGEINYTLKDVHAKVSVIWNFEAPEGAGDTHYSIMRGTMCNLIIQQGEEEGYQPRLYIESTGDDELALSGNLYNAIQGMQGKYPGITLKKISDTKWTLNIPDSYKVGHEAHFGQVTEKYLQYLIDGKLPDWEVPNMIVKYYTTTEGLKKALEE